VDLGKMHLEEMKRLNNPDVIEGEVVKDDDDA
jgi:hypothetical protein